MSSTILQPQLSGNRGSDANFTELLDEIYHSPEQSALEFTGQTVSIAPEIGTIIAVGAVVLFFLFILILVVAIVFKFTKK